MVARVLLVGSAVDPCGLLSSVHRTVRVCVSPHALSASEAVAVSCTTPVGLVVDGVAAAFTVGACAPQSATVTVTRAGAVTRRVFGTGRSPTNSPGASALNDALGLLAAMRLSRLPAGVVENDR